MSAVTFGTTPGKYAPSNSGDLVFFEGMAGHFTSEMIPMLDSPHPRSNVPVSHIGIVDAATAVLLQVAENVGDRRQPSVRWSQLTPGLGAQSRLLKRRLLVIPEPIPGCGQLVLDEARKMTAASSYSYLQLILAGLAAIVRQVPCTSQQRHDLWQTVHLFSRCVFAADHHGHAVPPYYSGTCVAMVDEAHRRAGAPLNIVEPQCPDPSTARSATEFIEVVVHGLERVADDFVSHAEADIVRRVDHRMRILDHLLSKSTTDPNETSDNDQRFREWFGKRVLFGRKAAVRLVRELRRFEMVLEDKEPELVHGLQKALGVLDATVLAVGDGDTAPKPGQGVFSPLMSLGLILDQYAKSVVEYQPF